MQYTKKEYLKYVRELKKKGLKEISFKDWKIVQPIADESVGKINQIIKSNK